MGALDSPDCGLDPVSGVRIGVIPLPVFALLLGLIVAAQACAAGKSLQYQSLGEIAVGGDTGWDYLSIDPDARRLYVAHGTHIVVIDLDSRSVGHGDRYGPSPPVSGL